MLLILILIFFVIAPAEDLLFSVAGLSSAIKTHKHSHSLLSQSRVEVAASQPKHGTTAVSCGE